MGRKLLTRVFKGRVPGAKKRIETGIDEWDAYFFVADNPSGARAYGCEVEEFVIDPGARILFEGTTEFRKVVGTLKSGELMHPYYVNAARQARKSGFDGVHFESQTDVGTIIFDPERRLKRVGVTNDCRPKSADTKYH